MGDAAAYGGLFLSAFVAATVFPAQSELVLSALLLTGDHSTVVLLAVASVGNVLGSMVNYVLGRLSDRLIAGSRLAPDPAKLARARAFYRKYGRWSLLLAWMPIIGDPITVVAGIMREPLWSFILLVTISKVMRYVALAVVTLQLV